MTCDSKGHFYQEQSGQKDCVACPLNTVRLPGVMSASNKSACRCKEGVTIWVLWVLWVLWDTIRALLP